MSENLIFNGDFSAGDVGFNAERRKLFKLDVGEDPREFNRLATSYGDRTTGDGNMLIINGSVNQSAIVWEQTVNVLPNASYEFGAWVSTWFGEEPANFQLLINEEVIDNFAAPSSTGVWRRFSTQWAAGENVREATIAIQNLQFVFVGNDFALDDISFSSIESTIPSNQNDFLVGTNQRDRIDGLRGNDRIEGRNGNDLLIGSQGNDVLLGGGGNDRLLGGNQADRLLGGNGKDRLIGGRNNDFLDGESGKDSLLGGLGNDTLLGGKGDDRLVGGKGNDQMRGGLGRDTLAGSAGRDTFVLAAGEGKDRIVDFQRGRDRIGLADGLSFGALSFRGRNIFITETNEQLATIVGFDTAALTAADFLNVS